MPENPDVPRPCPHALGALGVPARRWLTRVDLYLQLQRAKEYLDTAPLEEATMAKAAETAGISLHHFARLFHELYNVTPHRYLTQRRIQAAKSLLTETQLPVASIALEVGLENPSAFARLFKAHVGTTPLLWRKRTQS